MVELWNGRDAADCTGDSVHHRQRGEESVTEREGGRAGENAGTCRKKKEKEGVSVNRKKGFDERHEGVEKRIGT